MSSLDDLNAIERVEGSVVIRSDTYGDERMELFGRSFAIIRGFDNLEHIGGRLESTYAIILGMSSLEVVLGDVDGLAVGVTSLREVGGDLFAGFLGDMAYLGNLERVGGSFQTAAGDFDSLTSLREINGDLRHAMAGDVTFTPPALERVGGDLVVRQNDGLLAVSVPSLQRIHGRLEFYSNYTPSGGSAMVREAFADVVIRGGILVCRNGPDDPCPMEPECLEVYDQDYCCPVGMGYDECIRQSTL